MQQLLHPSLSPSSCRYALVSLLPLQEFRGVLPSNSSGMYLTAFGKIDADLSQILQRCDNIIEAMKQGSLFEDNNPLFELHSAIGRAFIYIIGDSTNQSDQLDKDLKFNACRLKEVLRMVSTSGQSQKVLTDLKEKAARLRETAVLATEQILEQTVKDWQRASVNRFFEAILARGFAFFIECDIAFVEEQMGSDGDKCLADSDASSVSPSNGAGSPSEEGLPSSSISKPVLRLAEFHRDFIRVFARFIARMPLIDVAIPYRLLIKMMMSLAAASKLLLDAKFFTKARGHEYLIRYRDMLSLGSFQDGLEDIRYGRGGERGRWLA